MRIGIDAYSDNTIVEFHNDLNNPVNIYFVGAASVYMTKEQALDLVDQIMKCVQAEEQKDVDNGQV